MINIKTTPKYALIKLFLLVILFRPISLPSQTYPTRQYTTRNGLPSMDVQCIFKDSRGLLWIGTASGLCTYDGKSFQTIKASQGMTANEITAIAEDGFGNMWFGSYIKGLFKYDGKIFRQFSTVDGLLSNHINVLHWSTGSEILIAGGEIGISNIKINATEDSLPKIYCERTGTPVYAIVDAGKFIYLGTYANDNPLRYYPDERKIIQANDEKQRYPANSFSGLITSKKDTVFSVGLLGVKIFKANGEIVTNHSMGQVFSMAEDNRGDLWFASWSTLNREMIEGVFKYDGKSFTNYKEAFGIKDLEIKTLYYDRQQDILWIGTGNEGLFMVHFSFIEVLSPDYFGLEDQIINALHLDKNSNLLISGSDELISMTPEKSYEFFNKREILQAVRRYWENTQRKTFNVPVQSINLAARNMTNSMISDYEANVSFRFQDVGEDPNGIVYFTNRFGIFAWNQNSQDFTFFGPEGGEGFFAFSGQDSVVFTGSGWTEINSSLKNFQTDSVIISFNERDEPRQVNRIVKNGNQIWYATRTTGLWMSSGMELTQYILSDSTISTNITDLCFDEKNHVFFGSNLGELYVGTIDEKELKIDHIIGTSNGLKGNTISWLVYDKNGYAWVGTNLGLNCISLKELFEKDKIQISFFDDEEGYTSQISQNAVIDQSGKLWIADYDNLVGIDTKRLLAKTSEQSKIVLQSIEINNQPSTIYLQDKYDTKSELVLNNKLHHKENDLIFNFNILNFINPKKDLFRHRLLGYQPDWSQWKSEMKAVFTNLPPGQYTLEVESYNYQSLQTAKPLNIHFKIRHPWWKLWYLQLIIGTLIGIIGLRIFWKYTENKRIKTQHKLEVEKSILELEMQALQAQMNPHFIFNSITGIQYYIMENKMDKVLAYLSDFSKVVRGSLKNATVPMVALDQEIEFLHSYLRLEEMRFEDKFEYSIELLGEEEDWEIHLPPMFVQPFIENSIQHGFVNPDKKGFVSVVFEVMEIDLIKCTITDNGIGRKKTGQSSSGAFKHDPIHSGTITEKRVRLFNTPSSPDKYKIVYIDLEDHGQPCGLQVELFLPMEIRGAWM